jgi:diguanylate cyclase (GGDEF)-like protein
VRPSSDPAEFNVWIFAAGTRSRSLCFIGAVAMIALVGLVDWITGAEIGLSLFYLVPVALVSWCTGLLPGLVFSAIAGGAWYAADVMAVQPHAHHPAIPIWNAFVRIGIFGALAATLARLRVALELEKRASRSDPLTGVWNSRAFREIVDAEIARCRRYDRPVSLAFVDVDDFKRVNDRMGHATGDLVLQSIAAAMCECLREVDVVARLGGDEFGVLLPETGAQEAVAAVEKLLAQASRTVATNRWPVTLSAGVATYLADPPEVDAVIGRADGLMYEAKSAGKNTIRQAIVGQGRTATHLA